MKLNKENFNLYNEKEIQERWTFLELQFRNSKSNKFIFKNEEESKVNLDELD